MKPPAGPSLDQLKIQIDLIPELRGAGIAFIGDSRCVTLRTAQHTSGLGTFVILQEADFTEPIRPPNVVPELIALGLNCAGAVASWGALTGEAVAAPFTGGATLALTLLTWSAAAATTAQCATSIIRSVDVTFGSGRLVAWLESEAWYSWAAGTLDGLSLVGAGLSTSAAIRAIQGVRRVTWRSLLSILKGLNRQERKRLTEEIIRMQSNRLATSALKRLIRSGAVASCFATSEINARTFRQIADAVSAALEIGSSAQSGNLKGLFVHLVQE